MEDILKSADFLNEVNKYIEDNVENKYDFLRRVINRMSVLKKLRKRFDKEKVIPENLINTAIKDVMDGRDMELPPELAEPEIAEAAPEEKKEEKTSKKKTAPKKAGKKEKKGKK